MKKKAIIVVALVVALFASYLGAFRGECWSLVFGNGCTYYHSKQYCFGWVVSESKWSDPADAPDPPTEAGHIGPCTFWRGFGLLWKRTVLYD